MSPDATRAARNLGFCCGPACGCVPRHGRSPVPHVQRLLCPCSGPSCLQLASVGRRPCGGPPGGGDGIAAPGPLFLLQCDQDVPADRLPVVGAPVQRAGSRVLKNCLLGLPYACCGLLID